MDTKQNGYASHHGRGTLDKKDMQTPASTWLALHGFGFLLLLLVVIIVLVLFILFLLFSLLRVVLLLFLGFLNLAQRLPLLQKGVCLSHIITHDDVVEDCTTLHLP